MVATHYERQLKRCQNYATQLSNSEVINGEYWNKPHDYLHRWVDIFMIHKAINYCTRSRFLIAVTEYLMNI